jgi:hypothetical protein
MEVIRLIDHPKREINLPRIMGATSKIYAAAPALVEKMGKWFFTKK